MKLKMKHIYTIIAAGFCFVSFIYVFSYFTLMSEHKKVVNQNLIDVNFDSVNWVDAEKYELILNEYHQYYSFGANTKYLKDPKGDVLLLFKDGDLIYSAHPAKSGITCKTIKKPYKDYSSLGKNYYFFYIDYDYACMELGEEWLLVRGDIFVNQIWVPNLDWFNMSYSYVYQNLTIDGDSKNYYMNYYK